MFCFYFFTTWSQISQVCGQSRLDGGMNFTSSVSEGQRVCRDVGTKTAQVYTKLKNGQKPDYVVSYHDRELKQDICEEINGKRNDKENDEHSIRQSKD